MLVKIGDKVYSSATEPIMLVLTKADKANLAAMHPSCDKFFVGPASMDVDQVDKFMGAPMLCAGCGENHLTIKRQRQLVPRFKRDTATNR